jgi:hypothetical protein
MKEAIMITQPVDKPFRVGVFDTVAHADRAVRNLLAAGFKKSQLAVMCSDKYKEDFFHNLPTPEQAGSHTAGGVMVGGVVGATIGGLLLAATAVTTGGATLLAYGTVLIGGGAFAGSFTGAMMTRGFENEIVNYYDQAVQRGKILVAVEVEGKGKEPRLAEAERILEQAGVEPQALPEG